MPSRSSDRRPSSAGIAPASVGTGVGNHASLEADRKSTRNPLWGAPRIHGELLKLGFEVAQSSVAKYMVKRCGPPSQRWCTFLRNHASDIAAMDLFVVPSIGFDLLYALVIVRLARRDLVWINVTTHPTADWIARQITEAFPWAEAPRYLICLRERSTRLTRFKPPSLEQFMASTTLLYSWLTSQLTKRTIFLWRYRQLP